MNNTKINNIIEKLDIKTEIFNRLNNNFERTLQTQCFISGIQENFIISSLSFLLMSDKEIESLAVRIIPEDEFKNYVRDIMEEE